MSKVQLADAPQDIVSSIAFSPASSHLLVGGWDGSAKIFDTRLSSLEQSTWPIVGINVSKPITAVCWDKRGRRAFLGSSSGQIQEMDIENCRAMTVPSWKQHSLGIQSIRSVDENVLVSGSWDKTVHYWDQRSNSSIHTVALPGKVFAMDTTQNYVVVAMSQRIVHVYDVRNMEKAFQIRESGLRYQTRDLRCMPNGHGYAQSSIEGRVAIEYFDPSPEVQAKKYAFKCHRIVAEDADLASPVNALTFHSRYNTLFTAGSDCHVCLWDHVAKKRLRQYSKFDQSVVSLDFNYRDEVNLLAVATSDDTFKTMATTDMAPKPAQSQLYLKVLSDKEGMPKSMKTMSN